jgi:hypothetical protein
MDGLDGAVTRRQLLVGGLSVGAAALIVVSTGAAGSAGATRVAAPTDEAAWGTVAEPGPADHSVRMSVGDILMDVTPLGFPDGWQLRVGDLVVVDLVNKIFWPHIERRADGSMWTVNRADARDAQLFPPHRAIARV